MVLPYCNKFSTNHEENIQLTDNDEKAIWVEKSSNLFVFPAKRNRLHNFTYTGSGHFNIGVCTMKDDKRNFKHTSRVECRKERNGKGAIVITSYGRMSIINGMHEIGCTELNCFRDTFIFIDIKFGDIKIKPEDCQLKSLGSDGCVNENNEASIRNIHPKILCSREKPFKPNDSIAFFVKKLGMASYWYVELLVSSINNEADQKKLMCLNNKEGQFDINMDQNYTVSHNGSSIFSNDDKVPLKLWIKIFRAEVTMKTLGENDTIGHYNRFGIHASQNDVNPDDSPEPSSSSGHHFTDQSQTSVKQRV